MTGRPRAVSLGTGKAFADMRRFMLLLAAFALIGCGTKPSQSSKAPPAGAEARPDAVGKVLSRYTLDELKSHLSGRHMKTLNAPAAPQELLALPESAIAGYIIQQEKSIYGDDRRVDYYDILDPKKIVAANSVAAIIGPDHFTESPGKLHILARTLGAEKNLCSGQSFMSQPTAAYCSAFVVSSTLVATAGHCTIGIKSSRIVFGFRAEKDNRNEVLVRQDIAAADVYTPTEVVAQEERADGADYALLKVDREIVNHSALPLHTEGSISADEAVYVLGFPSGLPLKMADHAFVRSVSSRGYFVSNLDTFGGNSGSPVLNASTHQVEGILVRGDIDYRDQDHCKVAFVCPTETGCRGEDSTLISALAKFVDQNKATAPASLPITRVFSSGPKISGSGRNHSGEYVVYSDPSPPGYKIANYTFSLSGDRACNAWSTCKVAVEGGRVAFRFSLQGHDEWPPPGQATSEGSLIVTYSPEK